MAGKSGDDNHSHDSYTDKSTDKSPKEPKNTNEPEFYINKHGKRVKKRRPLTEEEKRIKNEKAKKKYEEIAKVEGKTIVKRSKMKTWDENDPDCYIDKSGRKVRNKPARTREQKDRKNTWRFEDYRKKLEEQGKTLKDKKKLVGLTDRQKKDAHNEWKRNRRAILEHEKELKHIEDNNLWDDKEYWKGLPNVKVFEGEHNSEDASEHNSVSENEFNSEDEITRAMQESRDEQYRKDLNEEKGGGSSRNL